MTVTVARTIDALRRWRAELAPGTTVGVVPTMGYLHAGHVSLAVRAAAECDVVVATIFVNPAQFDRPDDLSAYPRDFDHDRALLEAAGCHVIFAPEAAEIYPRDHQTWVVPGDIASPLEGAARAGHFRGVATIVLKLFNLVQPHRAYFGQKDAQQVAVIRMMVRDLNVPVTVVPCPTVREPDGLAMSSRNSYLTAIERAQAPVVFAALRAARAAFAAGERSAEALRETMRTTVATASLARLDYVSVADPVTLSELDRVEASGEANGEALLSLAVFLGRARLIDNLVLPGALLPDPLLPEPSPRTHSPRTRGLNTVQRTLLTGKIHRATVTAADLHYVGSITLDPVLMDAAGIVPHERVQVVDVTNGHRLETYAIPGSPGDGTVQLNGAAAHLVDVGDLVIVMAYGLFGDAEARDWQPRVVHVDKHNRIVDVMAGVAGGVYDAC